ncbi:MAG: hypothetical protein COA67_03755 [Lutibacter sp.]|nr:MAG: hypothetical protein COA67_03755 [Lutibacter sp.]
MIKKILLAFIFTFTLNYNSHAQISFTESAVSLGVETNYGFILGGFGGGISFCDFDGDGWDDLTFSTANGTEAKFFKNNSGTFTEIFLSGITLETNETRQITWVDYDNDADKDLFIATFDGSNKLYQNNGSFSFADVTAASGFDTALRTTYGCSWGDYNNDGYLDAFLTFRDPTFSYPNKLYKNNGNGTFSDVSTSVGIDSESHVSVLFSFF